MSELVCRTLKLLAETKGALASAVKNIFNTRAMATLKISDLSVGDWVRCGQWNGRIQRIAMHDGETVEVIIEADLGRLYMYKRVDEVYSIPITPEILEANGFVKNGGVYLWSNNKHRVFVCLKEPSHYVDIEDMDEQFVPISSHIEVSQLYAHQLQRALRLAGVDKEINL